MKKEILKRHKNNPVLIASDLPDKAYYLLNPGAVKFNNEYLLLVDAFLPEGGIEFWIARSSNGYDFKFDSASVKLPDSIEGWQEDGVYDPRITFMDGEYLIMYGSHCNALGTRLAIVKTKDFINFERVSVCSEINNRNGAIFPEKIDGRYCRLDRPFGGDEHSPCDMWMSFSNDLIHWGSCRSVLGTRKGGWDGLKLGAGAPPIRVDEGWLEIYHGVSSSCSGSIYCLYAAILDYKEPWKVIARTDYPILFPEAPYEQTGRVSNVVFSCNAIVEPDNSVKIYYGAADACIGLAEGKLKEIIDACRPC